MCKEWECVMQNYIIKKLLISTNFLPVVFSQDFTTTVSANPGQGGVWWGAGVCSVSTEVCPSCTPAMHTHLLFPVCQGEVAELLGCVEDVYEINGLFMEWDGSCLSSQTHNVDDYIMANILVMGMKWRKPFVTSEIESGLPRWLYIPLFHGLLSIANLCMGIKHPSSH